MDIRPLPPEEAAVRRYVEELWLPYHRELETIVDHHRLSEDVDVVEEEVEFRRSRLEDDAYETWVAVDEASSRGVGETDDLAESDGDLAGFVTTEVDAAPPVFDRPDALHVGDLFVHEPYRGTGLARELVERATGRARVEGCAALTLAVDVENERAVAFYERLGFEIYRRSMLVPVDD